MLEIIKAVLFAIILAATPSPRAGDHGRAGDVPLHYGVATYLAARHHGLDPFEVGAILLAENRDRRYDPKQRGRYNGGGEIGLYQLKKVWAAEAGERCNAATRATHHRYSGRGDCLYIAPEDVVRHESSPRAVKRYQGRLAALDTALVNIEAAVIAFAYLQDKRREAWPDVKDWRALFRCSPIVLRPGGSRRLREGNARCRASVARVRAWERAIRGR